MGCRLIRYQPTNVITDFAAEKRDSRERETHSPSAMASVLFLCQRKDTWILHSCSLHMIWFNKPSLELPDLTLPAHQPWSPLKISQPYLQFTAGLLPACEAIACVRV